MRYTPINWSDLSDDLDQILADKEAEILRETVIQWDHLHPEFQAEITAKAIKEINEMHREAFNDWSYA